MTENFFPNQIAFIIGLEEMNIGSGNRRHGEPMPVVIVVSSSAYHIRVAIHLAHGIAHVSVVVGLEKSRSLSSCFIEKPGNCKSHYCWEDEESVFHRL